MTRLLDRLLGRVATRDIGGLDSTYSAFMSLYGLPDAERIQSSYLQYASEAYGGNAVVFGLIGKRMDLFSEAVFKYRSLSDKHLFGDPSLAKLETPWPNGATGDLLTRMELEDSLAGNAYIRDAGDRLERLRPDWVTIVSKITRDALGRPVREVLGYWYDPVGDGGRDSEYYLVDEVAHWAPKPDPLANWRGMSWLTPVLREIDADVRMTAYRDAYFRNSATPNIILKYQQKLGKDRLDRLRDMMAARHEGATNAFKTMVLDEGADLTVVGSSMEGATFSQLQAAGETRIAQAAGVPPLIAGLSEALNASSPGEYGDAMRQFVDMTMRPLWRSLCTALSVLVKVPDGAQLWYDTSDISALRPGEKDAADTLVQQLAALNQAIMSGYDPDASVGAVVAGDIGLLKGQHSGMTSVQMYKPGSDGGNSSATPDNPPPNAGNQPTKSDDNQDPKAQASAGSRADGDGPAVARQAHRYDPLEPRDPDGKWTDHGGGLVDKGAHALGNLAGGHHHQEGDDSDFWDRIAAAADAPPSYLDTSDPGHTRIRSVQDLFHAGDVGDDAAVRHHIGGVYQGHFGGYETRLTDVEYHKAGEGVTINGDVLDRHGRRVGGFERAILRDEDGHYYAAHAALELEPDVQGQGFAQAWGRHLEAYYRSHGIERIELHADIDVGGYAWARAGYDWQNREQLDKVMYALRNRYLLYYEYALGQATDPVERARLQQQIDEARAMIARVEEADRTGSRDYPTPYNIAAMGRPRGRTSRDDKWIGKDLLMGTHWWGVKWL